MPNESKRSKLESGSESDSEKEKEEKCSPANKSENPNDGKSSGGPKMENGEPTWELGQNKKVKVRVKFFASSPNVEDIGHHSKDHVQQSYGRGKT